MKSEPREVCGETRLRTRDAKVRHHREAESTADRRAMDCADDRFLRTEQPHRLHVEMADRRHLLAGSLAGLVERRSVAEIRARAERFSLRGKDDRAALLVLVEIFERIRDGIDQHHIEEIVRRTLDLDGRHMPGELHADVLVLSHDRHPLRSARGAVVHHHAHCAGAIVHIGE